MYKFHTDKILNSISDAVTVQDRDYNIVYFNKAAQELLNLQEGASVKCHKAFHGKEAPPEFCPSCGCWQTKMPYEYSMFEPFLNKHLEIKASPQFNESGEMAALVYITRDITSRKQNEKLIKASELKYRELTEGLPEIVFETDERGNFTYVNRYALEHLGYTDADIVKGLNCLDTVVPEERPIASETFMRVLGGGVVGGTEYRMLRKNGGILNVIVRANSLVRDGKRCGIRGVVVDITKQKQAEQALRESHELVETIIEATPT